MGNRNSECAGNEPDEDDEMIDAWDDVNGEELPAQAVKLARKKKLDICRKEESGNWYRWRKVGIKLEKARCR